MIQSIRRWLAKSRDQFEKCQCGHWRILHKWWGGCLAFHGRGVCVCPCFRKRK